MALRKKPVRSPRAVYKISLITTNLDDSPTGTDTGIGTSRPVFVKMKEAIGDWLGVKPVAWNDPLFSGTFAGNGSNKGFKYRKRLGGFREASYTLIAKTKFNIPEIVLENDGFKVVQSEYASVSIGFPKGHSVTEVIAWLMGSARANDIRAIVTPSGVRHQINPATN
jgi:hypothetical protein